MRFIEKEVENSATKPLKKRLVPHFNCNKMVTDKTALVTTFFRDCDFFLKIMLNREKTGKPQDLPVP